MNNKNPPKKDFIALQKAGSDGNRFIVAQTDHDESMHLGDALTVSGKWLSCENPVENKR